MTRERAKELAPIIKAYGDGAEIEAENPHGDFCGIDDPDFSAVFGSYRIKPTPRLRPMTRGEVLYMVTTTPGMVARCLKSGYVTMIESAITMSFALGIKNYEYAIIDRHGDPIDGWHKFEIEDDGENHQEEI